MNNVSCETFSLERSNTMKPSTLIRLYAGVKLDRNYNHVCNMPVPAVQEGYFSNFLVKQYTEQMYTRHTRNTIRIKCAVADIYHCNYLSFQNKDYSNKWFYAFIDEVVYINDYLTEVRYTLDIFQTWFAECTLGMCFVEREHIANDVIGANIVPEHLDIGEYITHEISSTRLTNPDRIVVATTQDKTYDKVYGGMYGRIYSGLTYNVFSSAADVNSFFENGAANPVAVFMMSSNFVVNKGGSVKSYDYNVTKLNDNMFPNYEVRNKKLYTYPYNFLYVTNLQGTQAVMPYEFFATDNCQFALVGDMSVNPSVILYPQQYKGSAAANLDEKLVLGGYPQCSYATDTFNQWLQQNIATLGLSAISTVAQIGLAVSNPALGAANTAAQMAAAEYGRQQIAVGGFQNILGLLSTGMQAYFAPNQAHGSQGQVTNAAFGTLDFMFSKKHITEERARIIDGYFDMFGYATQQVKVPNIRTRRYWNYVKTHGANIQGNIPCDALEVIKSVFDRGVTFWDTIDHIGDYSLDNRLLSEVTLAEMGVTNGE